MNIENKSDNENRDIPLNDKKLDTKSSKTEVKYEVEDVINKKVTFENKVKTTSENPKKGLTPYQGNRKTFGYFECYECNNFWTSAHSWADTSQRCLYCDEDVYPFKQVIYLQTF